MDKEDSKKDLALVTISIIHNEGFNITMLFFFATNTSVQ